MKNKKEIKHEKLLKSLGKFKKHEGHPKVELQEKIVKEPEAKYKVQRRRNTITIKKEPKQPLILQKRQGLQSDINNPNHKTGKLDMSTYQVMVRQYSIFMKKYNIVPVELNELIQLRINDSEPLSCKRFLKKYFKK